jgi:hypothetical protein
MYYAGFEPAVVAIKFYVQTNIVAYMGIEPTALKLDCTLSKSLTTKPPKGESERERERKRERERD